MCVALPEGGVEEEVEVNAGSDDQDLEQMEAIKEGGCASYHAPQSALRLIALLMMLGLTRRLTQRARQN
jgi:hypothetical protein